MDHTNTKKNDTQQTDMRLSVLSRIEHEQMRPKSKWFFQSTRCIIWIFWITTIIVGSIAVAELIYISMHSGIEFFEMTHGSLAAFVLDSLPFVWLIAFLSMVVLAFYNMRKTQRGYKYPLWQIIGSSILFTVGGGAVLYAVGVSAMLDSAIDKRMPGYLTVEERQMYMWGHPEDGRLTGTFIEHIAEQNVVRFLDSVDREWVVAIHELPIKDRELLVNGAHVRLLGESDMNGDQMRFYGCAALPWMPEKGYSLESLQEMRREVKSRLAQFLPNNREVQSEPSMRCYEIISDILRREH